jgi:hypothetical protein
MPKATNACNNLLALIFNATTWNLIAENDSTSPATSLYLSLHTADPGVGGSQLTNEIAYTDYARKAVVRSTLGWTVPSGGATTNAALEQFIICGASGGTATHLAIGTASSGAGTVLYSGALTNALAIALGIQPQFSIGAITVTET